MSAERLAIGDLIRCVTCQHWHHAEQPLSGSQTDYSERMLFYKCGAQESYVGQIGLPARDPARVRCGRCQGQRFTCEQHPDRPWPHEDCAAPLDACPVCNTGDPPDLPEGRQTIASNARMTPGWRFVPNALKQDHLKAGWTE